MSGKYTSQSISGCADSSINIPSEPVESLPKRLVWNFGAIGPFRNSQGDSVMRDTDVPAGIIGLYLLFGPSAIFWRIRSVIVNSIYRMLDRGPLAHILKKVLELVPSGANANSSAAISWIVFVKRIAAPFPDTFPNIMGCRSALSVRFGMIWPAFFLKATAASGMTVIKIGRGDVFLFTARTIAQPISMLAAHFAEASHRQATKLISSNVSEFWHTKYST